MIRAHRSLLIRFLRNPSRELTHALTALEHTALHVLPFALAMCALAAAWFLARSVLGRVRERRLAAGARVIDLAVPPELDTDGALLLWSALHDLLPPRLARLPAGQPHIAWEIFADAGGSRFRLWVPAAVPPGLVERALASAWPGITTESVSAEAAADGGGGSNAGARAVSDAQPVTVTGELVLSGPEWFPLGGGEGPDPLRLVLGQLAGLAGDEQALVQVVARPATVREQRRLLAAGKRIRAGRPTSRTLRLLELVLPGPPRARPTLDPTVSPDVRAVLEKSSRPLYRCLVRLSVTATDKRAARGRMHALAGAFAAYEGRVGLRRRRVHAAERKLRLRTLGRRGYLLSVPELAALAHLPAEAALPGLLRAGARTVPAPPGLPVDGKALGRSSSGDPVVLAVGDARYHLHLLGPTGVGKSTLIARLALDDLAAGRGAVVVDPKGDLVEDILARIPAGREERVDLLDPLDACPPGLNVLEGDDPELVVDQLVGIFRRVYEQFWGPRTDDILRAALLTLLAAPGQATLADVPRLLTDPRFREQLLAELDDPVGLEPFWAWYQGLGEPARAQATGPVLNKLRAFLLRRSVRAIVGQPHSTIDVAACLDRGRLLLVRAPKGTLGEDTSRLLGSFVVARVWQAALARAGRPQEERPDASLYVDEVQSYLNLPSPLADMLAEARGYRLSLCLAHQHLGQLPREMREAIAANARSKIYFQLSADDARTLGRELEPELAAHDLANLPRHTAAVRLCRDGEVGRPFTLLTDPLPAAEPGRAEAVRRASRARIGVDRGRVEARLARRQSGRAA